MKKRVAVIATFVLAILVCGCIVWNQRSLAFDAKVWQEDGSAFSLFSKRNRMLDDLTENILRKGMSLDEVEGLLGKKRVFSVDQSSGHRDQLVGLAGDEDLAQVYVCGTGPFSTSHTFLYVVYSPQHRVKGWRVSRT